MEKPLRQSQQNKNLLEEPTLQRKTPFFLGGKFFLLAFFYALGAGTYMQVGWFVGTPLIFLICMFSLVFLTVLRRFKNRKESNNRGLSKENVFSYVLWGLLFFLLGQFVGLFHSTQTKTPLLKEEISSAVFEGRVTSFSWSRSQPRILIELENQVGSLPKGALVRLVLPYSWSDKADSLLNASLIKGEARFYPPSGPLLPRGYDFRKVAYFEGLSALGYAKQVQILSTHLSSEGKRSSEGLISQVRQKKNLYRLKIQSHIREGLPSDRAGVLIALLTGEKGFISDKIYTKIQKAGLAHILAVSGLHMVLVAGMLFFFVQKTLCFVPKIALYFNTRFFAGFCSFVGVSLYFLLSGQALPAQRAYIMLVFVFGALFLQRYSLSLRTLGVAMVIIVSLAPWAVSTPSFILSFCASFILLAFLSGKRGYFSSLVLSSLILSVAFLPLSLSYFGHFSAWGVIANVLVLPLLAFWIMPLGLLLLPLFLFGGGDLVLDLLSPALGVVLFVTDALGGNKGNFETVHGFSKGAIFLYLLSLVAFAFLIQQRKKKAFGVAIFAVLILILDFRTQKEVSLFVEPSKNTMALLYEDELLVLGDVKSFPVKVWKKYAGVKAVPLAAECLKQGCSFVKDGVSIQLGGNCFIDKNSLTLNGRCIPALKGPSFVSFSQGKVYSQSLCQHTRITRMLFKANLEKWPWSECF